MATGRYAEHLEDLITEFSRMPGIGRKSAERLAFYILKSSPDVSKRLSGAIMEAKARISYCEICNNISESRACSICMDGKRDKGSLCVVEEPKDVLAIERSQVYNGLYHVLLGALSPLDGIGPEELKIEDLLKRVKSNSLKEVIIATDLDSEGESTALYLSKALKQFSVKITRLAHGIPVGANLEYTDQATMAKAIEGRTSI